MSAHPRLSAWVLGVLASAVVCASCTKEDPKAVKDEPKKTTPVPSDMGSFNDFLPPSGGASGLAVKLDGSVEGGLTGIAEGESGGGAPGGETDKLKVTDPGGEPRAKRKYAFVVNRTDRRMLTITQEQARGPQASRPITLAITMDFVPKQVKPTGSHWEAKVTKVELPGSAPAGPQGAQLQAALGQLSGMTGSFDVSPRGEPGELSFASDAKMQSPLAEAAVQGVSQAIQIVLPPLPDAPIGVGAKWERNVDATENGLEKKEKHVYTLKELTNDGGVVDEELEIKVPKRAVQQRGVPPGTMVAIEGKGKSTYTFRFDHLSTKVVGESEINQHIELTDEQGKKQTIDEKQKAKHLIEAPPGK